MNQLLTIILFCFFLIPSSFSADLEIKVNQKPIKLPYWPAHDPIHGGVIIVRGGMPVQWSDFLANFAKLLADNGWSTVLLNCSPEVTEPWINQLPEAISTLRQEKNKRIVLIHYNEELNTTLDYFSKPQGKMINGLILLSAFDLKSTTIAASALRFPVFDVVGQFDYDNVESQIAERKEQFKSPTYRFKEIPGADHEYAYAGELLASFLNGWMLRLPETTTALPPIKSTSAVEFYIEPIYSLNSELVAIN